MSENFVTIRVVKYDEAIADIQAVRHAVFQIEQGVDPALEFDGEDEAATHLLAYVDQTAVGTTRMRYLGDRLAKVERVAVLPSHRGQRIGRLLMEEAIAHLRANQIVTVKINAQTHARQFYEKLGFLQVGDEFEEAGIPHIEMRLPLDG
jgi:predicted GNAT family N-acyltransferase